MANGFSLIELLIALTIITVLSSIAYPQLQNYMAEKSLAQSHQAVSHFLNRARLLATHQRVFVGVSFQNDKIALTPAGQPEKSESLSIGQGLVFASVQDFVFTPSGNINNSNNDEQINANLTVELQLNNNSDHYRRIEISPLGNIALL